MEIKLTPELEAAIVQQAAGKGLPASDLIVRILIEWASLATASHSTSQVEHESGSQILRPETESGQTGSDLTKVYGAWGRAGYPVDGLTYERKLREEW